jgi:RHS repeat-associated protein
MVERVGTTNTKQFLHRDHQSSVTKITNAGGTVDQALAFDAWGLRRDATDWSALGSPFAGSHATERGYTGHEHLDTVGLIHMNGRVQDPILGRFISADPIVQAPYNTQSHNRYSYVWNNPASMIDPSGFDAKCIAAGIKDENCNAANLCDHFFVCQETVHVGGERGPDRGPRNSDFRTVSAAQLAIMSNNGSPQSYSDGNAGPGIMEEVVVSIKRNGSDTGGNQLDWFTIPLPSGLEEQGQHACPVLTYPDSCGFVSFSDTISVRKTDQIRLEEWEDTDTRFEGIGLKKSFDLPRPDSRPLRPPMPTVDLVIRLGSVTRRGGNVLQVYSLERDGYCQCTDRSGVTGVFPGMQERFPSIAIATGETWEDQYP